ncbi:MAG: hypothetical protein H0U86_02800 [Chloroflexi bacterium]|nr:hypothetical protein [Chloroflexota bacterium]
MRNPIRLIPVALAATAILGAGARVAQPSEPTPPTPRSMAARGEVTAASLNGTYRYELTLDEATEADMVDAEDAYPIVVTVTLADGDFEGGCFGAAGGTYKVDGDQVTFHSIEYDYDMTVTLSMDDEGNLNLTPDESMDGGDAFHCFSEEWTKIA